MVASRTSVDCYISINICLANPRRLFPLPGSERSLRKYNTCKRENDPMIFDSTGFSSIDRRMLTDPLSVGSLLERIEISRGRKNRHSWPVLLARVSSRLVCTSVARARPRCCLFGVGHRVETLAETCGDLRGVGVERWKSRRSEESIGPRARVSLSGIRIAGETCLSVAKRNLCLGSPVARKMGTASA